MKKLNTETWLNFWFGNERMNLNNLHLHFPSRGPNETAYPDGYYPTLEKKQGYWNKLNRKHGGPNSKKFLTITVAEFYGDFESTIDTLKIDREKFYYSLNILHLSEDRTIPEWEAAGEYACTAAWAILQAMLAKGYSKYDLTG
jgi:hypothetical protein